MDKNRQQKIYELLKRGLNLAQAGEELPAEWARELFPPERREYELVYHGKETEEQILADTMAMPFQEVSTFGQTAVGGDWHNKLIFGDNLQAMKTLLQMKANGKLANADGTPGVRLIYIDPPFSTKRDFKGSEDQKAYQDKIAGSQFVEFLRKRLIFLRDLLSEDGSIYIHLDYRTGHLMKVVCDEVFGPENFRNEISVRRKIKSLQTQFDEVRRLNIAFDSLFWYSKRAKSRFEPGKRKVTGVQDEDQWNNFFNNADRKTLRYPLLGIKLTHGQWRWKKERALLAVANYKEYKDKWEDQISLHDYWVMTGKKKEFMRRQPGATRCYYWVAPKTHRPIDTNWFDIYAYDNSPGAYPTQKSTDLLERIIESSSEDGDIIMDAFVGGGTTCAVAEKLGRRWIGIDCGKLAIYATQKRLLRSSGKHKPFTLYNAGLYDFDNLRQLPWQDWRFFALQLFECRDEPHKIHGFQMDGKRQGSSVCVFNHFDKGTISRETIADLHTSIGRAVGDRCFIIAPRGAFLFQEDYIELDRVRYYALRIPYSFINELHRREFSALVQPNDEMAVNETVDAVGFDFIQPPAVELRTVAKKQSLTIEITKFESRARMRGEEKVSGFDALSMAMVDFDYKGKAFDLDKVFYASEIEKSGWKLELPRDEIKGDLMLVLLDIYGNEARISIPAKSHRAQLKN
jgi:DNA modification methylase